mgnify:CR=1 FL=1
MGDGQLQVGQVARLGHHQVGQPVASPAHQGVDVVLEGGVVDRVHARADAADANNDPSEHVNALYAAAQDAYRLLAAARSEAA